MAATLLAPGVHTIRNVPNIADVRKMAELLEAIGCSVHHEGDTVSVDTPEDLEPVAPYELVREMRASTAVLGPLLTRTGRAMVAVPGGDDLGPRPIDMHHEGLRRLGAEVKQEHGYIEARADLLSGSHILLEFPSVGATESLLMAAVLAKGRTVIDNAAREPEVADLAAMLNRMGAIIHGGGSSTIEVEGVESLTPTEHAAVPDRIEAATYLAALGVAGGEVTLIGARAEHMDMLISKLGQMGMRISPDSEGLWAFSSRRLTAVDVATLPHPGIATDYQSLVVATLSLAEGVGIVTENIFSNRFRYIDELRRMGAEIRTEGHHAVVRGVERLSGAPVLAHDIRAGAALVVAALGADRETVISGGEHIDRGYEDLAGRLRQLGAVVERVD